MWLERVLVKMLFLDSKAYKVGLLESPHSLPPTQTHTTAQAHYDSTQGTF